MAAPPGARPRPLRWPYRPGWRRHVWPCAGLLLLLAAGCGPAPAALAEARPSARALAEDVLRAFERRDKAAALTLAVSEAEFREHIWPELPAARPERNLPVDYVWNDLRQKSDNSLSARMAAPPAAGLTLIDVRFESVTAYKSFQVHRAAVFVVRDGSGNQRDLRLCGSMVEQAGRWKVFSYVVDD